MVYNNAMKLSSNTYYDAVTGLDEYGTKLGGLIKELLLDEEVQVHSITHRVKGQESTLQKVNSRPKKYTNMSEITDLLGIRVITYFPNDVDKVAAIVREEFTIDNENSVDKRKSLDPDQFGYLSLHFVASMSKERTKLIEYQRFAKFKFEIQVRSILQHAWAEIEHDLGYKAKNGLPTTMRRSFSQLAGLLEIADKEFEQLRVDLKNYETDVNNTITSAPQNLMIDQSTIGALLKTNGLLLELDTSIAAMFGQALEEDINPVYAGKEAEELKALGIHDIKTLLNITTEYRSYILNFAKKWIEKPDDVPDLDFKTISKGISLFYVSYVIASQMREDALVNWRKELRKHNPEILNEVNGVWKEVVGELGEPKSHLKL